MNTIVDWDWDTPQWLGVLAAADDCGREQRPLNSPKCDELVGEQPSVLHSNTLWPLYEPLIGGAKDQSFVIGQIGQSLDGRIATPSGHSHYINGNAAIVHLHRLRALVDAVIVGVGTVIADDPLLTVRHAAIGEGKSQPARVVLDPSNRMPSAAKCLQDDGARRIVVRCGTDCVADRTVEQVNVLRSDGRMSPQDILTALGKLGLRRILVEGGAQTLSLFLQANCLQRLHIMTAPMIIGSGPMGIELKAINRLDDALRPRVTTFGLPDGEVLFDCAFPSGAGLKHD
jgi:diaminohydroxyphosphoribosylaminopyrimidine deaminase / 5-amino-6-(5-phosphoribosylamino)uracil reductase